MVFSARLIQLNTLLIVTSRGFAALTCHVIGRLRHCYSSRGNAHEGVAVDLVSLHVLAAKESRP